MTTHTATGPEGAARLLGISAASIRAACRSGEIPNVKVGKLYRIPTSWIREQLNMTDAEIADALNGGGEAA